MEKEKTTFEDLGLGAEVLSAIKDMGFEHPTPIQEQTIPHLLTSKQDIIALAQTGTGKTAAFGLPAIDLTDVKNKNTQTLVLCPTRELCLQISRDLGTYAKKIKGLNVVAVYGGTSIDRQVKQIKKGAHVVVGTPGRTRDLIERRRLDVKSISRLILDEADEMLTMGFKEELDAILGQTPEEKQTLLFSATLSKDIKRVTKKYMTDALEVAVAKVNVGATNVKHIFYQVQARDRYEVIKRIADVNPDIYGIVFCRTRRETQEVASKLIGDGYSADVLNGDLSQAQRDEVMGKFRKRKIMILVATDVAARGIDVNDLTHVINYNLPDDSEIYTHRSGRTGRAGRSGISIAVIHSRETRKIGAIERFSGIKFERQNVPTGAEICSKQLLKLIEKIEKVEVDEKQIAPFLPDIYEKFENLSREDLIKHFVSAEFNRFLSYYKHSRDLNVSGSRRDEKKSREKKSRAERRNSDFSRFHINVGSKNNLTPARLLGVINEALDSSDATIGKIEILKKFSFFEIDKSVTDKLLKELNSTEFEGVDLEVAPSQAKPQAIDRTKKKKYKGSGGRNRKSGNSENRKNYETRKERTRKKKRKD